MRKLLSLLTVLTITTPVPLNVIACGTKPNTPPEIDQTDYLTLAQTAQEKIQTEFAKLIDQASNLRTVNSLDNGAAIMSYLQSLGQTTDTTITDTITIQEFLTILREQVNQISNNLTVNYPELKPLFNGINPNDILKIDENDVMTLLTNKQFMWKGNEFGVTGFDAKKAPYNVTDWYHITANLKLKFTSLDENGKSAQTTNISQSYEMYFANTGANLEQIINVITSNLEKKLKARQSVEIKYTNTNPYNDSFVNQQGDILNKIKTELTSIIPKVSINTTQLDNIKDYHYMNNVGRFGGYNDIKDKNPLMITKLETHLGSETDFNNAWKTPVDNRLNDFKTELDKWIVDNNLTITNQDHVFVFGNYQTTNWSISGLEIKTLTIPYYVTTDKTRTQDTAESLKIVDALFINSDHLFKYPTIISKTSSSPYCFNFNIKSAVYDNFIKNDVPLSNIYEYISQQTNNFLDTKGIKGNKVAWTITPLFANRLVDPISKIPEFKITNKQLFTKHAFTSRLIVNGNAFSFSFLNSDNFGDFSITATDNGL